MTFEDDYTSTKDRYSIGLDTSSGRYYLSIPVSSGVLDYEEYYEITPPQHCTFLDGRDEALRFAEACRRREHDDLLVERPGWNRGTPV